MNRYKITTASGEWYFQDGASESNARRRFESAQWNKGKRVAKVELLTDALTREILS
jgi:hypothetical protein